MKYYSKAHYRRVEARNARNNLKTLTPMYMVFGLIIVGVIIATGYLNTQSINAGMF